MDLGLHINHIYHPDSCTPIYLLYNYFPKFWGKKTQVHLIIIRELKTTLPLILRNLDNLPPGAFYSTPLQLGTKEYLNEIDFRRFAFLANPRKFTPLKLILFLIRENRYTRVFFRYHYSATFCFQKKIYLNNLNYEERWI